MLVAIATFCIPTHAQQQDSLLADMDSVEISLLTCSPGHQVWSVYGHTALRYFDKKHHDDLAINWGMFSFQQKNFITRFIFGKTDYQMGIEPFNYFMIEYAKDGRSIIAQRLNLTREEKLAISQAIAQNYQPQNREYRYNFFYDNCTTRARDMIFDNLQTKGILYSSKEKESTWRKEIHNMNKSYPWNTFSTDLLLGIKADDKIGRKEEQFLPHNLQADFAAAKIIETSGKERTLVDSTYYILKENKQNVHIEPSIWDTITPRALFYAFLFLNLIIVIIEWQRKKIFWLVDVTLLTLSGLAGLILTAMIFSEHPTVSQNLLILVLNPFNLIFAYSVANQIITGKLHWYYPVLFAFCALMIIGSFWQDIPSPITLLAAFLLLRIRNVMYVCKFNKEIK
jgi:hypothetical protein